MEEITEKSKALQIIGNNIKTLRLSKMYDTRTNG